MRERHILRAWPLTPIHIGTGEELTPESFVLDGNRLRPINGFAALSGASDAERHQYQKLLKGGDFVGAQKHLAGLAKRAENAGETISVSESTKIDLEKVLNGKSIGKGGIRPFIRDGGELILPGSSLKGALRTAWIDQAITGRNVPPPESPRSVSKEARALNKLALDIEAFEQDPFRDIAVVDAPIPKGRTRYDKATLGKLDREQQKLNYEQTGGIQMHVERLVSLADGGAVSPFEIGIGVTAETFVTLRAKMGMGEGGKKRIVPKAAIGTKGLWEAANRFHADLWRYEKSRFYSNSQAGSLLDSLLKAFGLATDADLAAELNQKGLILLRVGRYSHFESKAVRLNGKWYGVNAQKKTFLYEGGGTRTTAKVANDIAAPFGWLLLALPGKGPQGPVSVAPLHQAGASSSVARSAEPRGMRAHSPQTIDQRALAGQLRFRKGDKVVHDSYEGATLIEDVSLVAEEMHVRFDDGDSEWLPVTGWKHR